MLKWWRPFLPASKLLSVLMYVSFVYMSNTICWFKRPNTKFGKSPHSVGRITYSSCPPLFFYFNTFMHKNKMLNCLLYFHFKVIFTEHVIRNNYGYLWIYQCLFLSCKKSKLKNILLKSLFFYLRTLNLISPCYVDLKI